MLNFRDHRAKGRVALWWLAILSISAGLALFGPSRRAIASGIQALATVPAGGTGLTTLGANGVLLGQGTANVHVTGAGTAGQCFTSNGAGVDPTFQACAGSGGGGITVFSGSALTVTANTYYFPIGGGATPSTTETNVDVEAPSAATITNFYVQMSVALGMGNTGVFTWRKAGANQSVTCTISGAAATTCNDLTHSFTVAQGDLIDVQLVTTGTIVVTPNIVMAVQFGTTGSNGTVNTGTVGQVAMYAANGTAVSGQTGGILLGAVFIATDETTTSTSTACADLATVDTVTFTLPFASKVAVIYGANEYQANGSQSQTNCIFIDGVHVDDGNQVIVTANAFFPLQGSGFWYSSSLSAASHTVTVKHFVQGGTGHWRDRFLSVYAAP